MGRERAEKMCDTLWPGLEARYITFIHISWAWSHQVVRGLENVVILCARRKSKWSGDHMSVPCATFPALNLKTRRVVVFPAVTNRYTKCRTQ